MCCSYLLAHSLKNGFRGFLRLVLDCVAKRAFTLFWVGNLADVNVLTQGGSHEKGCVFYDGISIARVIWKAISRHGRLVSCFGYETLFYYRWLYMYGCLEKANHSSSVFEKTRINAKRFPPCHPGSQMVPFPILRKPGRLQNIRSN